MIACVDVDYREEEANAAALLFESWTDPKSSLELVERISEVAEYEPGQFYKRELPCLMEVLKPVRGILDLIIVDGYVWLSDEPKAGLGAYLYDALEEKIPVIGVAKTLFASAKGIATPVLRGDSLRPLYVTAVGVEADQAAQWVRSMHGQHRLPTLLKRVDQLCRA